MFLQTTDMLQLDVSLGSVFYNCDCTIPMFLLDVGTKPLGRRGAMNLNVILNRTLR